MHNSSLSHYVKKTVDKFLDIAVRTSHADMGNLQLFDRATDSLRISAQHGFEPEFLQFFGAVHRDDNCACGRAMRTRMPVMIDDVEYDPLFAPYRTIAIKAQFRAVQSVPLINNKGDLIGVLSTHYRNAQNFSDAALRINEYFALNAADVIEWYITRDQLPKRETGDTMEPCVE